MDARALLNQVKLYDAHIDSKIEELARLEAMRLRITSTLQDCVITTKKHDKFETLTAKIIDLRNELNQEIDAYVDRKREVEAVVEKLTNPDHVTVLKKRYWLDKTWEQIAEEMDIDVRTAQRKHNDALEEANNFIEE